MLRRIHFTGDNGYQYFLVFAPILSSLILDSNKNIFNWILTGISSKKIKASDCNIEQTMSNLANGRVILKFNNSVLVQKSSSSLHSKFILNSKIVIELSNWPHNPTNNFPLKNVYLMESN